MNYILHPDTLPRKWWHGKTAYQIYPKSFCDSNGDGIGDLPGIISKLDYLQELGIEILWLSPIYCSPLADQGYDISDYYNIDPRFGTMEDMDTLLAETKKRGIHVLMDLVVNHCSDEHEWFKQACADPYGPYGDYFYIEKVTDGKLPCNWRSYFGGPVWDKLPGHDDLYYLHVFHKKQPDLKWENPIVREEIYKMINWWLDKGLSGFRIDAIINIKKALPWKDYPVDRADGLSNIGNMLKDAEGVGEFLGEMRDRTFAPHNALTVGEVFNEKPEEFVEYVGENGYFSTIFDFGQAIWGQSLNGLYDSLRITPDEYKKATFASQKKTEHIGFFSNIIENHDEPRGVSHYIPEEDLCDATKKLLATIMFMKKGMPFLYQGQEIGMENMHFTSIDQIDDIATLDEYKVALAVGKTAEEALEATSHYSRDNARTPFHWSDAPQAGFTTGTPWLLVNPNYKRINLASQRHDAGSVYQYYRKLIALRKHPDYKEVITYGQFIPYLEDMHNILAFYRANEAQALLVVANYDKKAQQITLEAPIKNVLLNNLGASEDVLKQRIVDDQLLIEGYQCVILELPVSL